MGNSLTVDLSHKNTIAREELAASVHKLGIVASRMCCTDKYTII